MRDAQECSTAFDRSAGLEFVDGLPEPGHPIGQRTNGRQRGQGQASEYLFGIGTRPIDELGDHRVAGRSHPDRQSQRDLSADLAQCHLVENAAERQRPSRCRVGGHQCRLLGERQVSEPRGAELVGEVDQLGDAEIRQCDLGHRSERTVIADRPCGDDDAQRTGPPAAEDPPEHPLGVEVHLIGVGDEDEHVLLRQRIKGRQRAQGHLVESALRGDRDTVDRCSDGGEQTVDAGIGDLRVERTGRHPDGDSLPVGLEGTQK